VISRVGKWRRFLPKRPRARVTTLSNDIFSTARWIVETTPAKDFETLDARIESYKQVMNESDAVQWLALLIMQAPRAAHAQAIMDEYPHGYHDREKRLYELIDFNDTLVSCVLLLPEDKLPTFPKLLKAELDAFCQKMYSREFDAEQFGAIIHGLSREIAVFKAAENAGLHALMSSRTADAFGIDMQIADSSTGRYINIDCKTSSSFHFRLKTLVKQHRMQSHDTIDAETKGWWEIINRDDKGRRVKIILLRVSQDELGEIRDFRFVNEQAMAEKLKVILAQRSLNDGQYGGQFNEK
jgi:hypothetical protein